MQPRYTEEGQNREATNEAWLYSAEKKQWTEVKYAGQQIPQVRGIPLSPLPRAKARRCQIFK